MVSLPMVMTAPTFLIWQVVRTGGACEGVAEGPKDRRGERTGQEVVAVAFGDGSPRVAAK